MLLNEDISSMTLVTALSEAEDSLDDADFVDDSIPSFEDPAVVEGSIDSSDDLEVAVAVDIVEKSLVLPFSPIEAKTDTSGERAADTATSPDPADTPASADPAAIPTAACLLCSLRCASSTAVRDASRALYGLTLK